MSPKQAKQEAEALRAQQKRNERQMRDAQARNAKAFASGEMEIGAMPSGCVLPIEVKGTTAEGIVVPVTVFEVTFGKQKVRKPTPGQAKAWLAERIEWWQNRSGRMHEQLKARARMARMYERLAELICETQEGLDEDTVDALTQSLDSLGVAIGTIIDKQ